MDLDQAASLLSGADMESTKALPAHGTPAFVMTDGSNGLARNLPGFAGKIPATCYPTLSAMATTWDRALVRRVARAIALDVRAAGAGVLLAPGMNLKRSPLGGRNFEYFSEDPVLTGDLASAFVAGAQSTGVAATAKHFAVNNQETDRMRVSADVDERALREVYLRAFEHVVRDAKPDLVMASYNRINGVYAAQNPWLLTEVLREEWGFDGVVVSDWGAVDDSVAAVAAGLDLQMPATGGASDRLLVHAVADGQLAESTVRTAAGRVAALARKIDRAAVEVPLSADDADALATEAAERSAVLLINERGTLPLGREISVALIGAFALAPRFQGAGSAGVNPLRPADSLVESLRDAHTGSVAFAAGYAASGVETSDELLTEAAETAAAAEVAIVVVGLPEDAESEGFDRTHLDLPAAQERAIAAVSNVAARTVVVVVAGGVVTMERWRAGVDAILSTGLSGQGVSRAVSRILTGAVSPSGRLAETIPLDLAHSPSHPTFPGERGRSTYGESIFVGYRGYDEQGADVAFPFGHGLSYTSFEYGSPRVSRDRDGWVCEVEVRNVGTTAGREVVQVYVSAPTEKARRARAELAGFDILDLEPGASANARVRCARRTLERWEPGTGWVLDSGDYAFLVSRSSRDVIAEVVQAVEGSSPTSLLTPDSTMVEWLEHPIIGGRLLERVAALDDTGATMGLLSSPVARLMIGGLPIKRLAVDDGNVLTVELLEDLATGS
ncbi:glycoside hydrolase family 3 C-terminal domain-containing protein [Microbacterium aoyamense]|nr:glycoside hydrolase family 3 N-terminal domain-containing protein [Microbacterium aoyamense]